MIRAVDPPDVPDADDSPPASGQDEARQARKKEFSEVAVPRLEPRIKVLIADDYPFVRKGIKDCINDDPGMEVVGESGTALGVVEFLSRAKCDVLVLDIGLPDKTGVELLRILKKTHPALPVLMLSMYPQAQFSKLCLDAGAAGFISKSNAPAQLVDAIRQVAHGTRYVAPAATIKPAP